MNITELISKMAWLSYSSAFVRSITIEEPKGTHVMRGQIHLILQSPPGSAKSTILKEIAKSFKARIITHLTEASLVGTIDSTKHVIPGCAWDMRNGLLILDEFNVDGDGSATPSLLPLLEDQAFEKRIARYAKTTNKTDGDMTFSAGNGFLRIRTRFACIIGTMKNMKMNREVTTEALVSRCIYIPYRLSQPQLESIADGERLMKFETCAFSKPFDAKIGLNDYKFILETIKNYPSPEEKMQYLRTVGDLSRAFVVMGKHDLPTYYAIIGLHQNDIHYDV